MNNKVIPLLSIITIFLLETSSVFAIPLALSELPLFVVSGEKANVLVILDNSNSMDEAANGSAVGSASPNSKSVIAREAIKDLITNYTGKINIGLMAYQQSGVTALNLDNSPYDISYNNSDWNANFVITLANRNSQTKKYRLEKSDDPGEYIYYNVALPYYHNGGAIGDTTYCYSADAQTPLGSNTIVGAFNNGEVPPTYNSAGQLTAVNGPWNDYRCFSHKVGTDNTLTDGAGYNSYLFHGGFFPTDSDIAQGITDFGTRMSSVQIGPTWFSNSSPGRGYLHTPISDLDASHANKLNTKLGNNGLSQFTDNRPTDINFPLQNAGHTPLEGTLLTAKDYFSNPSSLPADEGGGGLTALPESCDKDFIALLTDGLPSTNSDGTTVTGPAIALANVASAAAALKTDDIETYTIGFALPVGTASGALNSIAAAGGTGTAYLANDPVSLQATFDTVFRDILLKKGAASSAASNSTTLSSTSVIYQASFHPDDNWSGNLIAETITPVTSGAATSIVRGSIPLWEAATKLDAKPASSRVILSYGRDSSTAIGGIPFRWSNIAALGDQTAKNALDTEPNSSVYDGHGDDRVAYLRGGTGGGSASLFRTGRVGKLGDIIHSSPVYMGEPNAGYADTSYEGDTLSFKNIYGSRTPIIYTGANDGMLHGFNASSGEEVLAYVPGQLLPRINLLTAQGYGSSQSLFHQYFVDGTPMIADTKINMSGTPLWRTVLAAGLNGGGQGLYALDVTDPSSFTEANAAQIALWEFTDEDDADLGYTYLQPSINQTTHQSAQIAKMANGKWALIIGNGYNNTEADGHVSTTGHASLFIIFIEGGLDGDWTTSGDYIKIDTGEGTTSTPNGLATPTPIVNKVNGAVDYIYAGDLLGNLWKFDVSSTSTGDWGIKTPSHSPLFTASYTNSSGTFIHQPITSVPVVASHPDGGYMIGFGTGKYLEQSDITDHTPQSFYGIWDKNVNPVHSIDRSDLVEQTIIDTQTIGSLKFRFASDNDVDYPTKKGWYMDLPEAGERVDVNPHHRTGRFIFVTRTPTTQACKAGGSSWLMELDYLTGGQLPLNPLDVNGDGIIDDADSITVTFIDKHGNQVTEKRAAGGVQYGDDGMMNSPALIDINKDLYNKAIVLTNGTSLDVQNKKPPPPLGGVPTGRLSWEEIR